MEQFATLASTTLNGAINATQTILTVASASQFPISGNFRILIDSEIILVTGVSGTTFTVTRGQEGTAPVSHNNGVAINHILTGGALQQYKQDNCVFDNYANLSAQTSGRILFTPDSPYVGIDRIGGLLLKQPMYRMYKPIDSQFNWVNQGGATSTSVGGGILLTAPYNFNSFNLRGRKKTFSAAPITVTAFVIPLFTIHTDYSKYSTGGIFFRESSSGKMTSLHIVGNGEPYLEMINWTSPIAGAAVVNCNIKRVGQDVNWLQIKYDGTNCFYNYSVDGYNWITLTSHVKTTYFTTAPDEIGFFAQSNELFGTGFPTSMFLLSWKES